MKSRISMSAYLPISQLVRPIKFLRVSSNHTTRQCRCPIRPVGWTAVRLRDPYKHTQITNRFKIATISKSLSSTPKQRVAQKSTSPWASIRVASITHKIMKWSCINPHNSWWLWFVVHEHFSQLRTSFRIPDNEYDNSPLKSWHFTCWSNCKSLASSLVAPTTQNVGERSKNMIFRDIASKIEHSPSELDPSNSFSHNLQRHSNCSAPPSLMSTHFVGMTGILDAHYLRRLRYTSNWFTNKFPSVSILATILGQNPPHW